jgi:putative nucleotidyltransferase with HDIG domain
MAGSAIHRATLHDLTERRLHDLQALHEIDRAISSSLDMRVTLQILLEQTVSRLDADAADILLLNPHLNTLEYADEVGFRSRAFEHRRLQLGQGYAGQAALDRRIRTTPDLRVDKDFLSTPLLDNEGFIAYCGVPLVSKGQVKGVLEVYHRRAFVPDAEWLDFLESLARQAAIAIDNTYLFEGLQRSNLELGLAYDATIEGWSRALDLRDHETEDHTERVTGLTVTLARMLGVSDSDLVHVRRGALLHDIGKMGVPDAILNKPGPLNDEEWVTMRKHPLLAFEMLSKITFLRPALEIPYCHHEKWDGTGYPRGMKGEQIPLAARIFAVVDVWDALISVRPYRPAWSHEKARAYIAEQSGAHFDPQVVSTFLNLLDETE